MNLRVGNYEMREYDASAIDLDPRGIVWLWEKPRANASYVIACDPSYGIPSWNRELRTQNDEETDNCGIGVLRIGKPVVQVAEFAAPIDAEDAAAMVNFLGRMYAGNSEEEQAHAIIEVQPGPGLLTQRELINTFGYSNLFMWQHLDQMTIKPTTSYGWYSSRQSRMMLWVRGVRAIKKRECIIRSPWLVEEMSDAVPDAFLNFTARAKWGCHDDRLLYFLMGLWAANEWSWENAPEEAAKPTVVGGADYQALAMTSEEMEDEWNSKFSALSGNG